jgi:PAS domain S-box-containing protein
LGAEVTLEELYRLLRTSHVQAQGIVDTLQEPLIVLDRSCTVVNVNPAFLRTFRTERDNTLGQNLFELGNGQWDISELRELLADVVPKARAIVGYQVSHDFPDIGRRTMLLTARRLTHPDENSTLMLLAFEDATERWKADADKDVLLAETTHRMKNLLTVLRSVASQTQTEGRTAEQYRDVLLGRFEAVINAQLISANGEDADLSALIAQILQPVAGSRANVAPGPPVVLPQHQVLPVLMMLHELATNALKYGALSNASGVVHIGWNTADHDGQTHVLLDWREEGGPPVSPPDHQGFGTNLIQHGVNAEGGEVAFDFPPTGLCARITLPLAP